jgi:transposase InsO family protein
LDEKLRFMAACLLDQEPMTVLCERFGISRQTGHQLKRRYLAEGATGLEARSRAPHHHGRSTPADLTARLLELRRSKPYYGPKKLLKILATDDPGQAWPGHSSVSDLLRREGLSKPRRVRRRLVTMDQPFAAVEAPNDAWCVDFKGWFLTKDGMRCDPFTATDAFSRYLLGVQIMPVAAEAVRPFMDEVFQELGVPAAIRSDNGSPFGSSGAGGLTRLSAHWARLGIRMEFIQPGVPQQNGRHERMHRTLKEQACKPAAATLDRQQSRFDAFRLEFNTVRPHEALAQETPASIYTPSKTAFVSPTGDPDYGEAEVRKVRSGGEIKWKGAMLYVTEALIGQAVGLTKQTNGNWLVRFANVPLGYIDRSTDKLFRFGPGRPPRTKAEPAPQLSGM